MVVNGGYLMDHDGNNNLTGGAVTSGWWHFDGDEYERTIANNIQQQSRMSKNKQQPAIASWLQADWWDWKKSSKGYPIYPKLSKSQREHWIYPATEEEDTQPWDFHQSQQGGQLVGSNDRMTPCRDCYQAAWEHPGNHQIPRDLKQRWKQDIHPGFFCSSELWRHGNCSFSLSPAMARRYKRLPENRWSAWEQHGRRHRPKNLRCR